jgi:murein DD-endopeptidase MepM/ murein hydrolase activator NlpD
VVRVLISLALAASALAGPAALGYPDPTKSVVPAPSYGTYGWPVGGPVIRPFERPSGPFGPGHRGIDIGAPAGTPVRASSSGTVAFAGRVAGELHVSIDHPDGVRTGYSYLSSVEVRRGDLIARGEVFGSTASGHAGVEPSHLHFGARFAGGYIDPMLLLERRSLVGLIHLAPIEEGEASPVP